MTAYEAVYGIKSHREIYTSQNSEANEEDPDLRVEDDLEEREMKRNDPKNGRKFLKIRKSTATK